MALGVAAFFLVGCASVQAPPRANVYDFGLPVATTSSSLPGTGMDTAAPAASPSPRQSGAAIVLLEVEAPAAFDTTAFLYRLAYVDAQQLRPYAQARWSMTPAQLLRQRLRESLGQTRRVLGVQDQASASTPKLRLELEEFSQVFDSPQSSRAVVRLRATLLQNNRATQQMVWTAQPAAPSPDAAGGARALAQASDEVLQHLNRWLRETLTPSSSSSNSLPSSIPSTFPTLVTSARAAVALASNATLPVPATLAPSP